MQAQAAPAEPSEGEGDLDQATASVAAAAQRRWAMSAAVRVLAYAVVASCLVTIVAVLVAAWALTRPPEHKYFATRIGGELVELTPLDQPHRSDAHVLNFSVEAMTRALSLDFANYRRELADVEPFFTEAGWEAFLTELQNSGNLDLIRSRRMISSAVANRAVVLRKGLDGGNVWTWQVEMPLTITYQSASEQQTQDMTMLVEVKRVPTWTSDSGVAVSRLVGRYTR